MAHPTLKPDPAAEESAASSTEDIRALAYALWEARGCPEGSPEQDWFRAEAELMETAKVSGGEADYEA